MRLALFGGTFDPIHRGHLAIATAAADTFALDAILFAPTGRQPLKPSGPTASFEHRLAMAHLACAAEPRFAASPIDGPRPDHTPNYTVDTLATLATQHPESTLFNLVGLDSFLTLPHWHQPTRLLTLAEWIVVSRPGYTLDLSAYTEEQRTHIHPLNTVHEDIAATILRQRLAKGDPCPDLIPAPVAAYIAEHGLYRKCSPSTPAASKPVKRQHLA